MKSKGRLNYCVNCWSSGNPENVDGQQGAVIHELSIGIPTPDVQNDTLIVRTMKVENVLGRIFPQLKYLDDVKRIIDKGKDPLENDDDDDAEEKREIGLCETCSDSLTNVFKHFNQFNELRKLNSYLFHKLRKFDDLLHHLETTVNSSEEDTTMNIKSENEENSDEDFNCSDHGDVSNLMECEFNESDSELVASPVGEKIINNNNVADISTTNITTPTTTIISENSQPPPFTIFLVPAQPTITFLPTTTTTVSPISTGPSPIVTGPGPIVSVRRLNEDEVKAATTRPTRPRRVNAIKNIRAAAAAANDSFKLEILSDDDDVIIEEHDVGGNEVDSDDDFRGSSADEEDDEVVVMGTTSRPQVPRTRTTYSTAATKKKKKKKKGEVATTPREVVSKIVDGKCPICSRTFEIPRNLSEHLTTHIEDKSANICPLPDCGKSFTGRPREALLAHLKEHAQDRRHKCPVPNCGKIYNKKTGKTEHMKSHWKEGFFVCPKCDQIFNTQDRLDEHRSTSHPKIELICPGCEPTKSFETEKDLNVHLKTDHKGEKLYVCSQPTCFKTFKVNRHLLGHYAIFHNEKRIHRCPRKCGMRFDTEEKLKLHVDKQCKGERQFLCSFCPKILRDKRHFDAHVLTHKGELPQFPCTHPGCDKKFYTASFLAKHTPSHSAERRFTCELCGAACKSATTLKHHYVIHDGEKSHLCPHCGKSFLREDGLKKHLRVHSDRKGYKCQECGKEFKYSESCRLHYLTQHKEHQFICTICEASFPYNFSLQKHIANVH